MHSRFPSYINILFLGIVLTVAHGCGDHQLTWDRIIQNGELRFATVEGPATYYKTPTGPAGFEYELAKRFAKKIGVNLKVIVARNEYDVISMVMNKKAAIGGAALVVTHTQQNLKFGPAYYSIPQQLIYRRGDPKPTSLFDLKEGSLDITPEQLDILKERYPHAKWNIYYDKDINTLLRMVQNKEIKSTIAGSYLVNMYKHLYPDIRVAFNITNPQPIAWLYRNNDPGLDSAITDFFNDLNESGELDRLIERYFGYLIVFDYIDTSTFLSRITQRLPQYEALFKKIGKKYKIDWTLLAAMSYQESHWLASAKSPTGVRGLMMLTRETASHLGIVDRTDPEQSIEGGARYFNYLMDKIPERINQPDRTWMALASYNIGYQHLEHARVITQKNGGNPDNWSDIRKTLIQLGDGISKKNTKSVNIRWYEPAHYVRNIRKYRDILRWLNFENGEPAKKTELLHVLSIDSPVL